VRFQDRRLDESLALYKEYKKKFIPPQDNYVFTKYLLCQKYIYICIYIYIYIYTHIFIFYEKGMTDVQIYIYIYIYKNLYASHSFIYYIYFIYCYVRLPDFEPHRCTVRCRPTPIILSFILYDSLITYIRKTPIKPNIGGPRNAGGIERERGIASSPP